ncbi:MAG: PIN domain-containing protein, partial [Spirochaetia bacterium]|nr:PIN domain-containing protein [Spirochaetia bacterium]
LVYHELLNLLRARLGTYRSVEIAKMIRASEYYEMVDLTEEDEARAWQIFSIHLDKEYSSIDCTSFALMERLKIKQVISLDRYFSQYGFEVIP